jgi:hypothetical protein
MSAHDLFSESQQETKFEIDHASEEKKEYLFLFGRDSPVNKKSSYQAQKKVK